MTSLGNSLRRLRRRAKQFKPKPSLLLCPRVPEPLHGVNPRTILGARWWNETRKAAYRATSFHCAACGVWKHRAIFRQWLEGHERYDIDYLLGRMAYIETVALCHACHSYIHRGRLDALLSEGKISHGKYIAVVQHGDRVLLEANLGRVEYVGPTADWEDWRLIIDGVEYRSNRRSK